MEPKGRAAGKLQGAAAQGGNQSEEVSLTLLLQNRAKCSSGVQTLQGNLVPVLYSTTRNAISQRRLFPFIIRACAVCMRC